MIRILLLAFFINAGMHVVAQQGMFIEELTRKTELPEGTINCLAQDQFGFIWIGTYRGLYRYDGYEVLNFSTINPQFRAFKIKEIYIHGDHLWVGSLASGLYKINLTTYELTHYSKNGPEGKRISDDNVLILNSLPDSTILVGTEWGGLNIISASGEVSELLDTSGDAKQLYTSIISEIQVLDNDHILIANNGITLYNLKKKTIKQILPAIFNKHIYEIAITGENEFIIFTNEGVFWVGIKNGQEIYREITSERIKTSIRQKNYSDPVFLMGTINGFYELNVRTDTWQKVDVEPFNLSPLNITAFLRTRDDVILVGSENGLFSISSRKKHFKHYSFSTLNNTPNIISNIVKTEKHLFAGSWGNGILKLNEKTGLLESIRVQSFPELPNSFIYSMLKTENTIWFSTKDNLGVYRLYHNTEPYRVKIYSEFPDENNKYRNFTVTYIFERKDKTVLIGTWEGLLFYYDPVKDNFFPLKDKSGNLPLLRDFSIFSIAEDAQGNIWAGGNGCGLMKFQIEGNKIISQQLFTEENGLVSNFVTTVYPSRNNKIWVGTDAGLTVIEDNRFTKAFDKDIIYNIQSIIEDPIGFLWIGTQKGLLRINSNNIEEPVKLYETSDGLRNRSFYLNSISSDTDFTFYFGGYNGIDYFIPYQIEYNFNKPTPRITNFYLFNERIFPGNTEKGKTQEKIITASNTINLKYNQNTFSLEFSNLEYFIPEKCQFAFMLEGVDIEWNKRDARNRMAYYTKLKPGNYTFKLMSTNNDGVWSEEPASLSISIKPPLWKTTWAYIIYFVTAMFVIFLFLFLRIMKVQEKHRLQLKEIEYRKQKELDELKLKFFTNISHEFRTPLTLILGPLARIIENGQNQQLKEQHLMIYRNASRLLQLTNRIMDFRKSEKEQLKLKVEETHITSFIENIFLFFNYEAEKRNITYTFKSQYDGQAYIDQEFVESIVFNLLSNAFKYTPDKKSITVFIFTDDNWINISFADTGKGIPDNQLNQVFDRFNSTSKRNSTGIGLSFSKRLVEIHKGQLTFESKWGEGTVFTLCLPLKNIYTEEEMSSINSKENTLDWRNIDPLVQNNLSENFEILKKQHDKEQLIALIADDNFEVRQFLASLLKPNFSIIEAANGKEALEKAFEILPDIIISDVMMPEMDGFELCRNIKEDERTDHIPVVLTTVLSEQSDRIEGLRKGADSFIPKPIDPEHLMIRVNKLIEKQLKLKERFNLEEYGEEYLKAREKHKEEVHPLIEKARNTVLKNLDNSEYNIDDFCNDLGMSRMQLYRKFKAVTGLSANSFIRKVRLHKAAELLKSGELSVKEVTYDVGFIDLKYFRKCFYEEFGVNPSEFQQKT
jgi:signal transduction histidine kinase/DNA-binding response OmpR family regulator/ligand-binding sensor domain-containing protein